MMSSTGSIDLRLPNNLSMLRFYFAIDLMLYDRFWMQVTSMQMLQLLSQIWTHETQEKRENYNKI